MIKIDEEIESKINDCNNVKHIDKDHGGPGFVRCEIANIDLLIWHAQN